MVSVWLYVPNLIGYVRIISGLAAFWVCHDPASWSTFFVLYAFSYGLDAVDGVAARALGQTSRLGAVLDMVTDRFCTAALLALLSAVYTSGPLRPAVFTYLMVLDVVSHWAQMYSSLAHGLASHKSVADVHPLLGWYYSYPYALFWVCAANETFLMMLFLLAHEDAVVKATPWLTLPGPNAVLTGPVHGVRALAYVCFPVFALKQVISVVQLASAVQRIAAMDEAAARQRQRRLQ